MHCVYSGNRFMRVERCRLAAGSKRKRTVEFQTDPKKADGCLSAYVGNLKWDVTETDLRDFFKSLKISSIRFAINKRTGDSRGFCHVDFEDDESLEKAVGMNQSELRGRPIKISYAVSNRGWRLLDSKLWAWASLSVMLLLPQFCYGYISVLSFYWKCCFLHQSLCRM